MADFLSRFEDSAFDFGMVAPKDKILIACSGGPDSVALFFAFLSLRKKGRLKLGLAHFNHGLRGRPAEQDEKFVRSLAAKYQIPFYRGRRPVKRIAKLEKASLEEAARNARYDFLIRTARRHGFRKVASGHTQDDQAETVLMRVLQGTGLRGLAGIRPVLRMSSVTFIRPLLDFSKKELRSFLKENRHAYREDETNRSTDFVRNRLRLNLFPWLCRQLNPRVHETLARIPAIVAEENEILEALEQAAWKRVYKHHDGRKLNLDRKSFLKFPPALQFRLLGRALKKLDKKSGVNFDLWQKLKSNLNRPRFRYSLPRDIDFHLGPAKLEIYKKKVPQ